MKLTDSIRAQSQRPLPVAVTLTRDGTRVTISATAAETQPMVVQLVRTTDAATIDITRGENAGQQVTYSNIVESWDVLTQWDGADDLSLTAEVAAADQIVVIVQRGTHGAILGAAALN